MPAPLRRCPRHGGEGNKPRRRVVLGGVTLDLPYRARLILALVFLAVVPAIDFARHGARATRWREYGFWVGSGGTGAVFAAVVDQITSRVSRAYFVIGKQLADDATFPRELVLFGLRVGVVAGLAIGGALLIANNPEPGLPQLRYRALASFTKIPVACALVAAALAAGLSRWDVQGLGDALAHRMTEADVQRFLLVQRIHVGLYPGALVGTAVAWRRVRKGRGRDERAWRRN